MTYPVNRGFPGVCEKNCSVFCRGRFQGDLDFAVGFAYFVGADAARRGSAQDFAGFEAELSKVPGAGNASVFDRPKGDGGVGMGTKIVEGVDGPFVADECDAVAVQFVGAAFSFFEIVGFRNGLEHVGEVFSF